MSGAILLEKVQGFLSINVAGMAIMDAGELTLAAEICRLTLHIDTVTRERRIRERRLPKVQKRT